MSTEARGGSTITRIVAPIVSAAVILAVWWLVTATGQVRSFLVPAPGQVLHAIDRLPSYLLEQTGVTLLETLEGYAIAVGVGVLIGTVVAASRILSWGLMPLIVALNAAPKVAIVPLLTVWLGYGTAPKVVMAVLICVFPILLATATGLSSTPAELAEMAQSLSARPWQAYLKIRFPWALAQIFTGLKIAMPLSLIGAIIGELGSSSKGIGFVLAQASGGGDIPLAFAGFVLAALLGIVLYFLVVAAERLAVPWARHLSSSG